MPRITTDHFLVGYVRAKMEQLRNIIAKLDNEARHFLEWELEEVHEEVQMIHLEIKTQDRLIDQKDVESVMAEYRAITEIVENKIQARLAKAKRGSTSQNQPSTSQGIKRKKKKKSKGIGELTYVSGGASKSSLEGYASDNSEPMAVELLTKFEVGEGINLPTLKDKEQSSNKKEQSSEKKEQSSNSANSGNGSKWQSRVSTASFSSYRSMPQEKLDKPIAGITYPPMSWKLPYPLSKKDPNIIGISTPLIFYL